MKFYDGITEFIFAEDMPQKSDIIFVPGGGYPDAARRAAKLYLEGFAPYILPSGKYSITKGHFVLERENLMQKERSADAEVFETECEYLCTVLTAAGVPRHAVICESEATFTYENAICSRRKTEELGLTISRAILCCQAFHARRCLMYYQEQFPQAKFYVCPVVTRGISRENWYCTREGIDTVLGEVERCGAQFHEIMRAGVAGYGCTRP